MKQIMVTALIFLFISFIAYSTSTPKTDQTNVPKDWKTLDGTGYTIQYPDSLDLNNSGQMGTAFILFFKQTSQQDLFRENINLLIQDLSEQKMNLDKYVEISEEQIKTMITNGKIVESKRIRAKDMAFHKMMFTGDQGQYKLKFEQYYWIVKDKAYVLTLTCEQSQFDRYKEVGEKIMDTFKIK